MEVPANGGQVWKVKAQTWDSIFIFNISGIYENQVA
jgi:hypothetical protein